MPSVSRRSLLASATSLALAPLAIRAQSPSAPPAAAAPAARRFDPRPGPWRTFEVTTTVELWGVQSAARAWVPLPSVEGDWQRVLDSSYSGNAGDMRIVSDAHYGARMVRAEFAAGTDTPTLKVTSRVQTRNRATDWGRKLAVREDADTLRAWTQPTELMPTDGIVRDTALQATRGARGDTAQARALYEWVVANTWREPKVRGCGIGDIRTMLETRNLGGKCADLNALFVGMCRAIGLPARDVYGVRLAPSAFGYKELGANPASLKGAQHCRAEVYLQAHGWVAMDPADVAKVMRQEAPEWIKDAAHPWVAPVKQALFGSWEGNWLAYNTAHDVALPGSGGPKVGFLMYPQAETAAGRVDALIPDDFKYTISAREIVAS